MQLQEKIAVMFTSLKFYNIKLLKRNVLERQFSLTYANDESPAERQEVCHFSTFTLCELLRLKSQISKYQSEI